MLDDEAHLTRITKKEIPKICLHGTKREHVASIMSSGLRPGGKRGIQYRAHIHLVEYAATVGETSGVRGGSDVIVKVNTHALIDAGAIVYKSANAVFLTSGLWKGQNRRDPSGIP